MEKTIDIKNENSALAQTHSSCTESDNFDESLCVKEDFEEKPLLEQMELCGHQQTTFDRVFTPDKSIQSSGIVDETSENRAFVKTEPVDMFCGKQVIWQDDKDAEKGKALDNNQSHTGVILSGTSAAKDEIRTQYDSVEKPTFTCSVCEKIFLSCKELRDHHMCCHRDPKHFCDICNRGFTKNRYLLKHKKRVHSKNNKPVQCTICSKRLSSMYSLRCHMTSNIHRKDKRYQCELCGKSYNTESYWKIHQLEHKGLKAFSCGECDWKFPSQSQLKRHMICHISERPHKCKSCRKPFKRRTDLRAHELFVHDSAEICKICNKSVKYISKHMKRVHCIKASFVCGECKREFPKKRALVKHVARHVKSGRYLSCSFCNKFCFTQAQLDRHITTHPAWQMMKILRKSLQDPTHAPLEKIAKTTEFTFVEQYKKGFCVICEKSFANNSKLSVHMRSRHPGQKPFKCNLCDEAFVVHQYLKVHLNKH